MNGRRSRSTRLADLSAVVMPAESGGNGDRSATLGVKNKTVAAQLVTRRTGSFSPRSERASFSDHAQGRRWVEGLRRGIRRAPRDRYPAWPLGELLDGYSRHSPPALR